jgi:PAS domain S-box-containing protein
MRTLSPSRINTATLLAIAAMILCIVFVAIRMSDSDRLPPRFENHVWQTTQAQYDCVRLAESLARVAAGDRIDDDEQTPPYRLEMLLSRFDFFLEGPQRRMFEKLGVSSRVNRLKRDLEALEPALRLEMSREEALRLRALTASFASELRDIANLMLRYDREVVASTSETYSHFLVEGLVTLLGILLGLTVVSVNFLLGLREKRRAEQLLRQEQEFSDLVISLSNQGIIIIGSGGRCLLWNPGMEALLGINGTEALGRPLAETAPLFGRPSVFAAVQRALEGAGATIEEAGLSPALEERCLEISCHPLRMGERDLVIMFVRDVTERWQKRKFAERQNVDLEIKVQQRTAALRQAETRLIAAINTAPDGFAAFDAKGRLLMANERIRAAMHVAAGYRDDMTLSSLLSTFAGFEGADARLSSDDAPTEPLELDLRLQEDVWMHLSVTRADRGTVFVRLTDVTPYKQAALALQSALDREREMTSAYRSFVSMVSHQFRTPLAIIDSSAQRLIRRGMQAPEAELAARVTKIRNAITRLTRLVESVLNAAKLEAGQIEFNPARYDLVELVSDVCERQRELSRQVDIRFLAPGHRVEVVCDGILIEQVVGNLLSNAVKYSSGTKASVEIRIAVRDQEVSCSVRDWGLGIPADELPKVFDRFYRARTASGIAGTGIGLNVARQIMQMHGGVIDVESLEGEGSTFTFIIPITSAAQAPQAA